MSCLKFVQPEYTVVKEIRVYVLKTVDDNWKFVVQV